MAVIQFEDVAQFRGTALATDRYVEDGFSFTSGTEFHPGIRGWTITGDGVSITTATAFMRQLDGGAFGVLSLDAHGFNAYGNGQATYFTVIGNKLDGAQVSATFRTDGSFGNQVFKLPEEFHSGLAELYWVTPTYYGEVYNGGLFASVDNVVVAAGNRPPAPLPDAGTVADGERLVLDVLANDGDPDPGAVLSLSSVSAPQGQGAASIADGKLAYDPGADFAWLPQGGAQTVTLIYVVVDQHGAASESTVAVQVNGGNDAPTAEADAAAVAAGAVVVIDALSNDHDVDAGARLTLVEASAPAGSGAVSIVDNKLSYAPTGMERLAAGEKAQVTLAYVVQDEHGARSTARVDVTVTGANDGPSAAADTVSVRADATVAVDVLANDTDPDAGAKPTLVSTTGSPAGGSASIIDGRLVFAPGSDFIGLAAGSSRSVVLSYVMQDEHGSQSGSSVTVTVTGVNDAPTAKADTAGVLEDAAVSGSVLVNDADPDAGDRLSVSTVGFGGTVGAVGGAVQGRYGTLILNADGGYRYAADGDLLDTLSGVNGLTDVFTYQVVDSQGATHTTTLTIDIGLVDDARTTVGRNKSDVLNGDAGGRAYDDTLMGLKGDDQLNGGSGADLLYGGEGDDVLNGGVGRDKLFGEEADDRLDGGVGDDELTGGLGWDVLTGGAGADAFIFGQSSGVDTITDFQLGVDRVVLAEGAVAGPLYLYDLDGNGVVDALLQLSGGWVAIMNTGAATVSDFVP